MEFGVKTLVVIVAVLIGILILISISMGWLANVNITWSGFSQWAQNLTQTGKVQP